MNESRFKCKVVEFLRRELPGAWIYHPSDKWVSGVPDVHVVYHGRFAAIELKVLGNKPTKLQLHTLGKISAAGGITAVAYDLETVSQVVNLLKANIKP